MKLSGAMKTVLGSAAGFLLLTVLLRILYAIRGTEIFLSLYITFLTTSYHFIMRIAVGETVTLRYRHRDFSYDSPWYRQSAAEKKLYDWIRIRKWKLKLITAKPEQFDIRLRTYGELLHNMTQAEVVHEVIMVLSFVPLALIPVYGAPGVFGITSVVACAIDALFVMIQRFNRPRLLRLKQRLDKAAR